MTYFFEQAQNYPNLYLRVYIYLKKHQILAWREVILTKVKTCINEYLYPAKNNVDGCDSISDIFHKL